MQHSDHMTGPRRVATPCDATWKMHIHITILGRNRRTGREGIMGAVWKTKYGMRRVRVDLPTLEEALYAAQGLTPDLGEQLNIAAELMDLPIDQVRAEAQRLGQRRARTPAPSPKGRALGFTVVQRRSQRRVS